MAPKVTYRVVTRGADPQGRRFFVVRADGFTVGRHRTIVAAASDAQRRNERAASERENRGQ